MADKNQDLSSLISSFEEFFTTIYKDKITDVLLAYPRLRSIEVDYGDLEKFDNSLADALIDSPELVVEAAEQAIKNQNKTLPSGTGIFSPHIRFFNGPNAESTMIEHIGSKSLNELVTFKGVVTKRTDVMHKVKMAKYKCQACDTEYKVLVGRNFHEPKKCDACKKLALVPVEEEGTFTDLQKAEVQDLLEKVSGGSLASKMEIWLEDDLVNKITPGENIEVCGILRLKIPTNIKQKREFVYGRCVEAIHARSLKRDFEEIELSREEEKKIIELSRDPSLERKVIASVAPAIYGYSEVKQALALQLFGGTKNKMMKGDAPLRDDVHILLIGDPGIAKTRFLQSITMLAPKSIYVSGKSVSSAGLTASAEKDELGDGGWTLKAGALVLASGGMCAIDEFDKIDDEDRASMHEVMESQSVSIAKAGIVAKFKAKTAIIAAANPKHGRFNQTKNLADQFDIPPSLLSRFDLLFPIMDVLDEEKDSKLADHILSSHAAAAAGTTAPGDADAEVIEKSLLRKYITYARRYVHPVLSDGAKEKIKHFYVDLRKMGKNSGSVPITPRYIEGLVRLSEAHAKMRLSNEVEDSDAEAAITLMKYVLMKVLTDQETGRFDVDIIATGKARSQVEKIEAVVDLIKSLTKDREAVKIDDAVREAEVAGMDPGLVRRIIHELLRKGELYEKEPGWISIVGKEG
ncbi:MAG: minichromosome maintenance protein MCM [Candidatus Micrarchaeia archaeon]|jgi:replicative DNA helicase Mcm